MQNHFPGSGLAVACLAGLASAAIALAGERPRTGATTESAPVTLREVPLLFVDDSGIRARQGVVRTIHPAQTRSLPVLQADQPWEGGRVYTYGSVYYDEDTRLYRLWYMSRDQRPGPKPAPQLRGGGVDIVLLATSRDGVHWEKPALGLHEYHGSAANNIVADLHSPAVVRDRFDPDPAKRYKLLGYFHGAYFAAESPDGVRWNPLAQNPVFKGNDTMSMTQDPNTGEFMAYFKQASHQVPGRVVWLTRSPDFQTWSEPKLVFHADKEDNSWTFAPGQQTEVYNMTVLPHATGFIGLPTIFRVMARAPKEAKMALGQSSNDGPIDVQLVTSTDGENWQRTWPRVNVIPRGAPGTFDSGAILGTTSTTVDAGDKTWIYYTGLTTGHGGALPTKRLSIGRAEWRRHGFASLDAGPAGGRVETKPIQLGRRTFVINADASRGKARVALFETDGRSIQGFSLDECEPLTTDSTEAEVRWKEGRTAPTDRPFCAVIEMTNTRLFSIASAGNKAPE